MNVPLLDLKAQYRAIQPDIDAAVRAVFESQHFILGASVESFEREVAAYSQAAHAIGVASGTDALLISLMAEGIGPGDEVITTPYTFFATAGCIARLGARPVFVDILPDTYNINPALIEARITSRTKAIMPVHLYGQMADMDPIMRLAAEHKLTVIEDAAQAIGAEYKGKRAGSIGHYGCFSFFPSKNLGGAGDGGLVTALDERRAAALRTLRNHGMDPKYYHKVIGGNFRLDALQAAVLSVKLRYLDAWHRGRRANAARYTRLFKEAGLAPGKITLPAACRNCNDNAPDCHCHIYNQYVIRTDRRDALRAHLSERNIGTEIYYPVPLHLQECFTYLKGKAGDHPESEKAARETLALPIYPELTEEQAACVVASISDFFRS